MVTESARRAEVARDLRVKVLALDPDQRLYLLCGLTYVLADDEQVSRAGFEAEIAKAATFSTDPAALSTTE